MRPLEILSLSVLAATLVAIPVTWSKRPRWLRFLLVLPATAMLLQVLIEGYRWQMVPAYALSVLILLAGLLTMIKDHQPANSIRRRRVTNALVIAASFAGLSILWITVELCVQLPVFKMPLPSGPYAVGTRTFLLIDESRIDNDSPINNGFRTMSIEPTATGAPAPTGRPIIFQLVTGFG